MVFRKYMISFKLITTIAILTLSTIIPALAFAAPKATSAQNWEYVNGNSWAQNYSPNDQINVQNADQVEVKWIFSLAGKAASMDFIVNDVRGGGEGSSTPPVVANGRVFIQTNYMRTVAVDAASGKLEWDHDYVIDMEEIASRLPIKLGPRPHFHGFRYWEGGNMLLNNGLACDIYGVDADTGENTMWIKDLCADVPGNMYEYYQYAAFTATSSLSSIGTYDNGRQFIVVLPGSVHGSVIIGDARHVTVGINMDTEEIEWRVFGFPPHGVLTKDWALQECSTGWFRDIACSDVAAAAPENLEWDWAGPNNVPSIYAGVTANWGQAVVDEDTGMIYTQTGNQGPYPYIGHTPGPRLYGSALYAVDMNTGQRAWWQQPMPRDPYDYDCNWSGVLAEVPTLGKVYMKGCKEGLLMVMDAATGEPHYMVDLVEEQVAWGQITDKASTEPHEGQGGVRYHTMDPFSKYDMLEMEHAAANDYCPPAGDPTRTQLGEGCHVYPAWSNGIFATDMSYDPESNTLFHYAAGLETTILSCKPATELEAGDSFCPSRWNHPWNTTVVARDATTGAVKWTWYYDPSQIRSHMAITKELVVFGLKEGSLMFMDKENGNILKEMTIGSDMKVGITTGQDSNGDQKYFTVVGLGTGSNITPSNSGTLIAVGLSERAQAVLTVTQTQTSRTTVTQTSTSTSVSTQTQTSTSTSVSTSVSTSATTITIAGEEVEVGSTTITYAAVVVAVIAVIAAAVLYTRKQ